MLVPPRSLLPDTPCPSPSPPCPPTHLPQHTNLLALRKTSGVVAVSSAAQLSHYSKGPRRIRVGPWCRTDVGIVAKYDEI